MRSCWILLWAILTFSSSALASVIELRADIDQVILYPDLAMIKKTARVSLRQGENVLRLSGVTPALIDNSVQISIEQDNARIRDIEVRETYLEKIKQERLDALRLRLEKLNGEIKSIENEMAVHNSSIEFLKKVIPFSQNQNTPIQEISAYLAFLEKRFSDNLTKTSELEARLTNLKEERKAIENELDQIAHEEEKSKEIVIKMDTSRDGECLMVLSYLVKDAGWSPAYDVRVDSNTGRLSIDYLANINQSTGEDWKNVSMSLTTQRPAPQGDIPELAPWHLDIYTPPPPPAIYYKTPEILRKDAPIPEEIPQEEEEQEYQIPEPVSETTSVSFPIPYKVDIPSDGQSHRIVLATARAEGEIKYYSVPKLLGTAIATSTFKNPFSFPMLAGPVNIFLDGRFVNSSKFKKTIIPEDKILVGLGVDEGIKIDRKLDRKFTEYSGTFSKNRVINYEYSITITNGKNRDIDIEIKDHHPVPKNEKIKVELKAPQRSEAEISEDGLILWKLTLKKAETKKLFIKFTVEHPRDLIISGLE